MPLIHPIIGDGEFVIRGSLGEFMEAHPDLSFVTKDAAKEINPEIALKFSARSAKFHLLNILDVIRLQEQAAGN